MRSGANTLAGIAEAAIAAYRFVKPGTTDLSVVQATAATSLLLGISNQVGAAITTTADYIIQGEAELELGGTVVRGGRLTSDASGKGVATVTAGDILGAIATVSGVAGDIIPVIVIYGKY
jgi:hypothetical protein